MQLEHGRVSHDLNLSSEHVPASRSKRTAAQSERALGLRHPLGNQMLQRLLRSSMIQPKLRIGEPNDEYEQEADRIAEQVMSMPEPRSGVGDQGSGVGEEQSAPVGDQITPLVQRLAGEQVADGSGSEEDEKKEEEPVQTKLPDTDPVIQRQGAEEEEKQEEEPVQTKALDSAPTLQRQEADEEKKEGEEPIQTKLQSSEPTLQRQASDSASDLQRQDAGEEEEKDEEPVQAKSVSGAPGRGSSAVSGQRLAVSDELEQCIHALKGGGQPLDAATRTFFEARVGHDLGKVRVHHGPVESRAARAIAARAFTVGRDIVFGSEQYQPSTEAGRRLMAHELAHVAQQTVLRQALLSPQSAAETKRGKAPDIQRKIELRPPRKGVPSAFGRRQELINQLNAVSTAMRYQLNGQSLEYTVVDATALTYFESKMKRWIDLSEVVPMLLVTQRCKLPGVRGPEPLVVDDFGSGYVDMDDLLAGDIHSFKTDLLHFLTERFQGKGYEKSIRTGSFQGPPFLARHRAGEEAEAAYLRDLLRDPSLVFVYDTEFKSSRTWEIAFKSKALKYWVFQKIPHSNRELSRGEMWVLKSDGKRMNIDDFRKERAGTTP